LARAGAAGHAGEAGIVAAAARGGAVAEWTAAGTVPRPALPVDVFACVMARVRARAPRSEPSLIGCGAGSARAAGAEFRRRIDVLNRVRVQRAAGKTYLDAAAELDGPMFLEIGDDCTDQRELVVPVHERDAIGIRHLPRDGLEIRFERGD